MHNKLVRDKIPDIIFNSGHPAPGAFKVVDGIGLQAALINKFDDELKELRLSLFKELSPDGSDPVIEDLVDVLEIAYSLAEMRGISKEKLDIIRLTKREYHGGFEHGYIMNTGNK